MSKSRWVFGCVLMLGFVTNVAWAYPQDESTNESAKAHRTSSEFGFEEGELEAVPEDWTVKGGSTFFAQVVADSAKTGKQSLRIASQAKDAGMRPTGSIRHELDPEKFRGQRLRFRSSIKADLGEKGQIVMWLREDLKSGSTGAFDAMGDRPIKTSDWGEHDIVADISKDTKAITVGFLIFGEGEVRVDDVVFEVVDNSIAVTSNPDQNGLQGLPESAPGLFEILGAMEVRANLKRLKKDERDKDVRLLMPLPLRYADQYPLTFNLSATPANSLKSVRLFEDQPNNFVAEVVLQDMAEHKAVEIKFSSAIMVLPSSFQGVPATAAIPDEWPDEAKPWLESTWCVEAENERIQQMAREIRSETDDVLEVIAQVELRAGKVFAAAQGQAENLTAVEALDKQGSCTSCGNLVAAMLRASDIPARVLAGYPSWSGPLQTHYIVEAFVPGFGWYPIESTMCRSPWPNEKQVNVAIIPTDYESKERAGYRPGVAGGVPYLSLSEMPENQGAFTRVGTIPDHDYCNHECKFIRKFEGDEASWSAAAEWATPRWNAWLGEVPEVVEGKVSFGPEVSEIAADSPLRLIEELSSNDE